MEEISRLKFPASYDQLELIRKHVERFMSILGLSSEVMYDINFSITELVTNIIKHGYEEKGGTIEVIVCQQEENFVIKIRDKAPIFNPILVPSPDLSKPLKNMPLGGLGLHITKNLVDSLKHRITKSGGNEITIVKKGVVKTT